MSPASAVSLVVTAALAIFHLQGCIDIPGTKKWSQPEEGSEEWNKGKAAATQIYDCQNDPKKCEEGQCKNCNFASLKCPSDDPEDKCCDCEEVVEAMKKEGNDKAANKKKMKAKEQKQLQNKKKKKSLVETGSNSTNGSFIPAAHAALQSSELEAEVAGLAEGIAPDLPASVAVGPEGIAPDLPASVAVGPEGIAKDLPASVAASNASSLAQIARAGRNTTERRYHPVRVHGHEMPRRT